MQRICKARNSKVKCSQLPLCSQLQLQYEGWTATTPFWLWGVNDPEPCKLLSVIYGIIWPYGILMTLSTMSHIEMTASPTAKWLTYWIPALVLFSMLDNLTGYPYMGLVALVTLKGPMLMLWFLPEKTAVEKPDAKIAEGSGSPTQSFDCDWVPGPRAPIILFLASRLDIFPVRSFEG